MALKQNREHEAGAAGQEQRGAGLGSSEKLESIS